MNDVVVGVRLPEEPVKPVRPLLPRPVPDEDPVSPVSPLEPVKPLDPDVPPRPPNDPESRPPRPVGRAEPPLAGKLRDGMESNCRFSLSIGAAATHSANARAAPFIIEIFLRVIKSVLPRLNERGCIRSTDVKNNESKKRETVLGRLMASIPRSAAVDLYRPRGHFGMLASSRLRKCVFPAEHERLECHYLLGRDVSAHRMN